MRPVCANFRLLMRTVCRAPLFIWVAVCVPWGAACNLWAQDADRVDPKALEIAGWQAYDAGRFDEAQACFQRSVDGGNPVARRGLVEVHRRQGDVDAAVKQLHALLAVNPDDQQAKRDLAAVLASMPDQRDEAVGLYDQLLERHPTDHALKVDKAFVLAWSGQYQEAQSLFEQVLDGQVPTDTHRRATIGLADTHSWSGRHRRAAELYRQVLTDHRDAAALRGLADIHRWRGRPGAAAVLYRDSLDLDADHGPTRDGLTWAQDQLRPTLFGQTQYFTDSSDWQRLKALATVRLPLPRDLVLELGAEGARYRDRSGDTAQRASAVTRARWLFNPFTELFGDLAVGSATGNQTTLTGGLGIATAVTDRLQLHTAYRHDHFIDDTGPFNHRPYNGALTVRILEGDELDADKVQFGGVWALNPKTSLLIDVSQTWLEDSNKRLEFYGGVDVRVIEDTASRVSVRSWYHHSDFDRPSLLYFSPSHLESYGLGVRIDLWPDPLRFFFETGVFYQPAGIGDAGYQVSGGLVWRVTDRWRTEVYINHLNTAEREDGRYKTLDVRWNVTLRF